MSNEYDKSELDTSCENELNFEDDPSLQNDPSFKEWLDEQDRVSSEDYLKKGAPF